ncbi:cysteine hydrolase family protein [Proteiniclasticum ruminis]|uniref:Nicotinamidase-related amidase n=1 Tax=Proteiniclasticum ruminis TaxID=398199 RepID=A0A1I4YSC5_9CLOT|nr:isochorismatase family cysteine hydrolase [Proteiniclasticum ruminis]SFN40948.1 Nicotinamidase-related amidase [Proteiniclasticum ruminis]
MNKLVVVIDMVKGFAEEGTLASKHVKRIIEPIRTYLEHYSGDIVFVSDAHDVDSSEFHDFPVHCIKGTREAEVVDRLQPYAHTSFQKNSVNAFQAESFRMYLMAKLHDYEKISIIGCCTDICILNFALALKSYVTEQNLVKEISVPQDLVATFDGPGHDRVEASESAFHILRTNGIKIE